VALGERAGHKVRRVVMLGGKEFALGPRCASFEGYNVHANVALPAHDRKGLERLCRYVLRPPLAVDRIERRPDGRVRVGMKRVWSDGTDAPDYPPSPIQVGGNDHNHARRAPAPWPPAASGSGSGPVRGALRGGGAPAGVAGASAFGLDGSGCGSGGRHRAFGGGGPGVGPAAPGHGVSPSCDF